MSNEPSLGSKPIFVCTDNDVGQRLDNYLLRQCKQLNKAICYKLIRKGQIRINGKRVKPFQKLISGDQVRVPPFVYFVESKIVDVPDSVQQKLLKHVIFEDDDYLVLNKPAGLPCHTGTGHDLGVIEIIKSIDQFQDIQLAHRLDKETSGCLLLAKNRPALLFFQEALKLNKVTKTYLAILEGRLVESTEVDQPLDTENRVGGIRTVLVSEQGKSAKTTFTPLDYLAGKTLVECRIDTGRTHQIRVHAQHLNMPVWGDQKYGSKVPAKKRKLYLHAYQLYFNKQHFEAPQSNDFNLFARND